MSTVDVRSRVSAMCDDERLALAYRLKLAEATDRRERFNFHRRALTHEARAFAERERPDERARRRVLQRKLRELREAFPKVALDRVVEDLGAALELPATSVEDALAWRLDHASLDQLLDPNWSPAQAEPKPKRVDRHTERFRVANRPREHRACPPRRAGSRRRSTSRDDGDPPAASDDDRGRS